MSDPELEAIRATRGCLLACLLGTIAWILLLLLVRFAFQAAVVAPSAAAVSPYSWSRVEERELRPLPAVAPTPQPTPSASAARKSTPAPPTRKPLLPKEAVGAPVRVGLSWYCNLTHREAPRSRCVHDYPDVAGQQLYAAASPDLLARGWRGKFVRVVVGGADVIVRVIDCNCQATRSLDLYSDAFLALAPLGRGRLSGTAVVLR